MLNQIPWMSKAAKSTLLMRAFGLAKIPLLFMCSPRVIEISDSACKVLMPFRKIVKNHLGSMYFGAMAIGADTCVGMLATDKINQSGKKISLVFKSFKADFLRRAEGDTLFVCEQGEEMNAMIEKVIASGERVSVPFKAQAFVNGEVVAEFELTLSLKLKQAK
jgi:acyl-coenzyme A thioesterase PaaI-like protein